jgi:uncharacterized protein
MRYVGFVGTDEARELYRAGDAAHDFDHVLRVVAMASLLARAEGADEEVVSLAALLHDVPCEAERGDHHLAAADFAARLLTERGMQPERVANVAHCIRAHRYRDRSEPPRTLEAMCLYDADKLDSMGAIGVARTFAFAGVHGNRLWTESVDVIRDNDRLPAGADYTPVHEFVFKLSRLQATLHTETGKRLGEQRHQRMAAFFAELDREMQSLADAERS